MKDILMIGLWCVLFVVGWIGTTWLIEMWEGWRSRRISADGDAWRRENMKVANAISKEREHIRLMGTLPPK